MKKNWPIFLIVLIVIGIVLFFFFKNKKGGKKNGNGNGNGNGDDEEFTPIGKTAYASYDGVKVYNADTSLYKTAKNGEWIGKVSGEKTVWLGGGYNSDTNIWEGSKEINVFIVSGGRLIDRGQVYLEDLD